MTGKGRGRVKRRSPTIIEQFTVVAWATAWRIFRIFYPKSNTIACFRKDGGFSHGLGQFERFTPSELSDRNGFVNETFAGMGVTDGSAPIPDLAALAPERAGSTISLASNSERVASLGQDRFWDAGISRM